MKINLSGEFIHTIPRTAPHGINMTKYAIQPPFSPPSPDTLPLRLRLFLEIRNMAGGIIISNLRTSKELLSGELNTGGSVE